MEQPRWNTVCGTDVLREYSISPIDDGVNSPRARYHEINDSNSHYTDFDNYTDDIDDSSPSPPERHGSRNQPFTGHPVYAARNYRNNAIVGNRNERRGRAPQQQPIVQFGAMFPVPFSMRRAPVHQAWNTSDCIPNNPFPPSLPAPYHQIPGIDRRDVVGELAASPASSIASVEDRVSCQNAVGQGGSHPRGSHSLRLRPVSELPDIYRSVFKFGVFNAIQSTCFDAVLHSHENLVISAPTGSGKTVLFELGIVRMLTEAAQRSQSVKCVYVSPTKALCTEKYKEWTAKFAGLGIKTCELTGDTVLFGNGAWGDAKNAQVIVTTAEKWDSLTRHWADHTGVLSQIQLFLVDEVHILNESRGSTLEVVVSRMKSRGSAVRFILVSATVPNIEDVASWIGSVASDHRPARVFQFGEEYRPCKLTRFVYGVPKPKGQNDFAYAHALDNRLFSVLQQHSANKPILVFCPTRKGTLTTAKHLAQEYEHAMKSKQHVPWSPPPQIEQSFQDKDLAILAAVGIGVHHAGLNLSDKKLVEELFMKKTISVLLATSTLAVGVNLPAHMVVIKGVKIYQSGETKEYSDLDMMQMMGRAGRPQFDTDGIAIILCENELESKYRALTQGTTTLESSLHTNLIEHLNSEIGLGTIADLESAKGWLRQSFLYRRIQKNPDHYEIGKDADETWQDKVDEIVMQSVDKLQQTQLIDYSEASGSLGCTEYGDIMSKFYLRRSTMHAIMELPPTATMREILEMMSFAEEFADLKMRGGEKQTYDKIRRNADIRFPVKKIQGTNDKIFLLVQAVLGGLPLGSAEFKTADSQPSLEAFSVFRHIARIATAVVEVAIIKKNGAQTKNGLALVRSLYAKAWDDRPIVLRQVEHIGEKSVKILAEHNITTFDQLLKQDTFRIETLLGRRSPFGFEILTSAREFPRYFLNIVEVGVRPSDGKDPVEVELTIECGTADDGNPKLRTTKQKQKGRGMDMTTVLTVTSDLLFIDFRRIATKALKEKKTFSICAQLTKPSQTISVIIASDKIAGLSIEQVYKPKIAASKYPTLNTRPLTSVERDLEGLEDCPDFWDMNVDDECDENVPIKDLTESRDKAAMSSNRSAVGMSSKSPVNQAQDQCEPKKRSDGKYDCNHPCKDKSTCRHLCCRDGLPEPPRGPKKRLENPEPIASVTKRLPESKPIQVVLLDDVPNVKKQKRLKSDPVLRQLDDLHRGAGVDRNIKLPEGRRLKMDDSGPSKGQRKPAPNFDLELTTLRCSVSPAAKIHSGIASDDDEMLTISELLDVGKTARSESNYSNSEVDALIRNLPLGGGDDEVEIIDAPPFAALPPMPVTLPRKRARSPVPPKSFCPFDDGNNDQPQPKRIKSTTKDSNRQFGSPSGSLKEKNMALASQNVKVKRCDPLFLYSPGESDVDTLPDHSQSVRPQPVSEPTNQDEFYLDESCFDIIPNIPELTAASSSVEDDRSMPTNQWSIQDAPIKQNVEVPEERLVGTAKRYPWLYTPTVSTALQQNFSSVIDSPRPSGSQMHTPTRLPNAITRTHNQLRTSTAADRRAMVANETQPESQKQHDDPLAEFESWLASGAVDIID